MYTIYKSSVRAFFVLIVTAVLLRCLKLAKGIHDNYVLDMNFFVMLPFFN